MRKVGEGLEEAGWGAERCQGQVGGRYGDGAARGLGGGGGEEEREGEETASGGESPWTPVGRMRRLPGRHGAGRDPVRWQEPKL